MSIQHLRIKRKTLAYEAHAIRAQERNLRGKARVLAAIADPGMTDKRLKKHGFTEAQLVRINRRRRANVPHYDVASAHVYALRLSLYEHRIGIVRPMSRAAHLAHAYLVGSTYASVEGKKSWGRLSNIAQHKLLKVITKNVWTFGDGENVYCKPKDITHWIEGGSTLEQEAILAEKEAAQRAEIDDDVEPYEEAPVDV